MIYLSKMSFSTKKILAKLAHQKYLKKQQTLSTKKNKYTYLVRLSYQIRSDKSAKSIVVSVEAHFSFGVSSLFLNADRPSPCGMFGYNLATSIVHKIMPSSNFGREQSVFRNSLVSLI